jgi:hypothetical protein
VERECDDSLVYFHVELIILVPTNIFLQYILLHHNTGRFLLGIILVLQVLCDVHQVRGAFLYLRIVEHGGLSQ